MRWIRKSLSGYPGKKSLYLFFVQPPTGYFFNDDFTAVLAVLSKQQKRTLFYLIDAHALSWLVTISILAARLTQCYKKQRNSL
jgi:hypothetical protein